MGADGPTELERRLLAEFRGAYGSQPAKARGERHLTLRAAPTEVQQFDGRTLRAWTYNGTVPGPILRVRLGERLRIELQNDLPQPTTVHWHGLRVPNAMDGAPGVTQPLVQPGERFVYRFTPKDAGTFWFHPHHRSSEQVERGLYGVLVVEEAKPAPYSRDVVWVLDDWRLTPDGGIDPAFNTRHDLAHDGRWGQVITVNGSSNFELSVRSGERIRLRLLNAANGRVFAPDLTALDAKVIAVDGQTTARPLDPNGFEIAPGNRLDLDVLFGPSTRGQSFEILDRFTRQPFRIATIRVLDEEVAPPVFPAPTNPRVPAWQEALSAPVRAEYRLNARSGGPYGIEWTLNGQAGGHPVHEVSEVFPLGRFSRLRFVNESFRLHPMHVHGQFFKLLARNGVALDEPFFRDTVLVHAKETVDVGMVPLDPGVWMLHCHVLEHAEAGMMTTVEVR